MFKQILFAVILFGSVGHTEEIGTITEPANDFEKDVSNAQGWVRYENLNYFGKEFLAITAQENFNGQHEQAQLSRAARVCRLAKKGRPVAVELSWQIRRESVLEVDDKLNIFQTDQKTMGEERVYRFATFKAISCGR